MSERLSRSSRPGLIAVVLLVLASPGLAQARRPAPAAIPAVALSGFGHMGLELFSAKDSFNAILGTRSGLMVGGGAEARFRGGLFAGLRISRFQKNGTRVFVTDDGEVFDLGLDAAISVVPIESVFGYRFLRPSARAVPYLGGGVGWYRYQETSDFADSSENVRETHQGYYVLGGLEWRANRWWGVAGEGQWTTVPDALGQAATGVSAVFDETDLGGLAARVRFLVGR